MQLIDSSTAPLQARSYFQDSDPGPIVAALAQVPELLTVAVPFISKVLGPIGLGIRIHELVIVRASALMKCEYCTQSHAYVALKEGLDQQTVGDLMSETARELGEGPDEVALLNWVDAVVEHRNAEAERCMTKLQEHFDDAQVVELTALLGATVMLNIFCTALELPTSPAALETLRERGLV